MSALRINGIASGLWPTPTCPNGGRSVAHVTDWRSERTAYSASGKKVQVDLAQAVKRWPTTRDRGTDAPARTGGPSLAVAVRRWTTPTAHNAKEGGFPSEHDRNTPTLAAQAGGSLNPTWVEWLMAWPLGWTDLKPLGTDKFRQWRRQHSENCPGASDKAA